MPRKDPLNERMRHAWDILRGVRQATKSPQQGAKSQRFGSPAKQADDDLQVLSASYEYYRHYTHLEPDRISIYSDMDEMFQYVLVHAALEAYVEDATQLDTKKQMALWVHASDPHIQSEVMHLLETLEIEDRLEGDFWGTAKYGDHFNLLLMDQRKGVFDAIPLEPRIVHRHQDRRRVLEGFSVGDMASDDETQAKAKIVQWKPWDMVHFRNKGKRSAIDPYGAPFFLSVRLIYKVLKLMEEQMVIYRMNMHPDRLIFKIFTGAAGTDERRRAVQIWRKEMERLVSLDHQTGKMTSEYSPWLVTGNIYWPVGQNDNVSGVEKFPGSANSGDIFDIEYTRDLMFAGMRVPKAYMGFEDSQGYRGTDTLSSQSIKFARGVKKLQRMMLQGYMRLCRIHLAIKGYDCRDPKYAFNLEMTPVSYLDEAHKAELYAKRFEAMDYMLNMGQKMQESLDINTKVWAQYVLKEFGQFDDSMIGKLLTPNQGDALNFEPAGTAVKFEKSAQRARRESVMNEKTGRREFKPDDLKRIRDALEADNDLKEAVTRILPTADLAFGNRYSSLLDRQDLGKIKDGVPKEMDFRNVDEAIATSKASRLKADKDARKRLQGELRYIAETAAKSWQS